MIMRKFHHSIAVGFLMGTVVAMSQYFFCLFLLYIGIIQERMFNRYSSGQEVLQATFSLVESILLGLFAVILAAHRSEILETNDDNNETSHDQNTADRVNFSMGSVLEVDTSLSTGSCKGKKKKPKEQSLYNPPFQLSPY